MLRNNQFSMLFTPFQTNRIIYRAGDFLPFDFLPKENYLIRALLYRQTKQMNTFILVTGRPRTSKSAFCIKECERIAEIKGQEFDIDKQLTLDDIKKFFYWSKSAYQSMFIIDEIGTQLSTNQYWSVISSIFRVYTQTQGFRENIVFMVLPFSKTLQTFFKYTADYGIKTIRQGRVSVYKTVVDTLSDKKPFFKPKYVSIDFTLPKEKIWLPYLQMKKEWNDKRLTTDIDVIDKINETNEQKAKNYVLRQRSLELSVALKQHRMDKLQNNDNIWSK
jgi:hypothetical protein